MGEILYIPSYWFHYIVSQDASIQCNARSGISLKGQEYIDNCGFKRKPDHNLDADKISTKKHSNFRKQHDKYFKWELEN